MEVLVYDTASVSFLTSLNVGTGMSCSDILEKVMVPKLMPKVESAISKLTK